MARPRARPQLEPTTGFLIVRVAEAIDRRFQARLRPLRLRPRQLHVLRYLDAAGAISQSELADGISVDPANLVETLDQLEAEGLIRRDVDSDDRRRRRISLTPAGRRKLRAGLRAAEQADKDVLGALERQELDSLRETVLRAYRSAQSGP
jgi:MarR family transcriptional regulator, lower aerobic nicotinate degradation pathway regulator